MKFSSCIPSRLNSIAASLLSIAMLLPAYPAAAQISVGGASQLSIGTNGQAPQGTSGGPIVAANGKFLVFRSDAPNLIANDANQNDSDIFLNDLSTGALSLISVSSSQIQADDQSRSAAISPVGPDGWFAVAFMSQASNLSSIPNVNGFRNVFLRFPTQALTLPVSFGPGAVPGDDDSDFPSVTIRSAPNKALVVFSSLAENLVSDDSNGNQDIFLAEVAAPESATQNPADLVTTTLISRQSAAVQADGDSSAPRISTDGRFVVFASKARNLIAGRTVNTSSQIYLYSVETGALSLLSQNSGGIEGDDDSTNPIISYSGRYVAFLTTAQNIVSGVTGSNTALVLLDRETGAFSRVNSSSSGTAGNGSASDPAISPNGRFITFADSSDNLVSNDSNGVEDVFIKEIATGAIARSSNPLSGDSDGDSDTSSIAGTSYNALSGFISFRSFASNLTSSPTIGGGDVFLTGASYQTPVISKGFKLETPGDVSVTGKKVTIGTQKFTLATPASDSIEPRAGKKKLKFDVRIEGTGKRKKERFQIISARNTVAKRNLKPGVYTTRYRVITQTPTKSVPTTPFSPRQTFQVQ